MKLYTSFLFLALVSMLSFVASVMVPKNEVLALKTFKEAVYEDPHMVLSNWNTLDSDLCDWNGVSCTATRDHVIKLILHGNSLVGVIPKELGMLKSLKVLDLGINHLIGPIPPEIGNLTQVMKMGNFMQRAQQRIQDTVGRIIGFTSLYDISQ